MSRTIGIVRHGLPVLRWSNAGRPGHRGRTCAGQGGFTVSVTVNSRIVRGIAVVVLPTLAGLVGGLSTGLLTTWASRTRTVFMGNGALALEFSIAPAFVAAVWIALVIWRHFGRGWMRAGSVTFAVGFVAAMFVNFFPWLFNVLVGMDLSSASLASNFVAVPATTMVVGLGLARLYTGLTKTSVAVGVALALLIAAVLDQGLWFAVPLLLLPALALPLIVASAAKPGRSDAPRGLWLWFGLLSTPIAFFAGLFGPSVTGLLK